MTRADHFIPRWILRSFRDKDGNYYSLERGDKTPRRASLKATGSRPGFSRSNAGGRVVDTEKHWTDFDDAGAHIMQLASKSGAPRGTLVGLLPFVGTLPLRVPTWRDAAAAEAGAHLSNAGSMYIAKAVMGVQMAEAVARDAVNLVVRPAPNCDLLTSDAGAVFDEQGAILQSFALPWQVSSFEPDEPEPDYDLPPRPLRLRVALAPDLLLEYEFLVAGKGGFVSEIPMSAADIAEFNVDVAKAADHYLYGQRTTLANFARSQVF